MIINELLFDKYRVQKNLDQETNYSISRYVEETHKRLKKLSAEYKLSFQYGVPGSREKNESPDKAINSDA